MLRFLLYVRLRLGRTGIPPSPSPPHFPMVLVSRDEHLLFVFYFGSKTDPETIPKVSHNMMLMLHDASVSVQKKAIQVTSKLYRYTLMWLCRSKSVTGEMELAWSEVCELKKHILKLIDSDLDG